jgi:hypothetical protein
MTADPGDIDYIDQSLHSQICDAGHGMRRRGRRRSITILTPTIQQTARYCPGLIRKQIES